MNETKESVTSKNTKKANVKNGIDIPKDIQPFAFPKSLFKVPLNKGIYSGAIVSKNVIEKEGLAVTGQLGLKMLFTNKETKAVDERGTTAEQLKGIYDRCQLEKKCNKPFYTEVENKFYLNSELTFDQTESGLNII